MATAKKSSTGKGLQNFMGKAIRAKKADEQMFLEWEMAFNTNGSRKDRKVWDQHEINALYSRDDWRKGEQGATKTCHVKCHNGNDFEYIVVKRHQTNGYIDEHQYNPDFYHTGNQLVDEIRCFEKFALTDKEDYLCPILKYFTSKSDQVTATSETMQNNVCIIAQKAVYVSDLRHACLKAAELNGEEGEAADRRYREMRHFAEEQGWRDAVHNGGNSGVIYDYAKQTYKAVFIDYAL